jgi:hypothetical protein
MLPTSARCVSARQMVSHSRVLETLCLVTEVMACCGRLCLVAKRAAPLAACALAQRQSRAQMRQSGSALEGAVGGPCFLSAPATMRWPNSPAVAACLHSALAP